VNLSDGLWDAKTTAEYLGVTVYTVYRYAEKKALPHIKKKFGLRFRRKDLDSWLEKDRCKGILGYYSNQISMTEPPIFPINNMGGACELNKFKSKRTRYNFGYGAIYQRKTKKEKIRWYLDYRDSDGNRIQKVAPLAITKEEAYLALQEEVRRDFDKEYRIKRERQSIKFKDLADMYLENYAKSNKRSWQDDRYRIEAHMKSFFGEIELQKFTPLLIEKYRAERLKTGVTKSTVNREITIMKKMFNLAIDWNLTDKNPVLKIKLFSEKDTMKERILTEEEERKLMVESPDYLKPIIVVALNTGMRRGEILNLKWKQLDLEKRLVRVENTKSGKNRMIPINDFLWQELLRVRNLNGKCKFVFPNPDTDLPYTEVKKSFKSACKRAGIDDLRFHDLRHTFATRLIESGVDLITVRDLLGHFSVRVTQRYTHSSQEQKKAAVELLLQKSLKKAEKQGNLLHSCDMNKEKEFEDSVSDSYAVN